MIEHETGRLNVNRRPVNLDCLSFVCFVWSSDVPMTSGALVLKDVAVVAAVIQHSHLLLKTVKDRPRLRSKKMRSSNLKYTG